MNPAAASHALLAALLLAGCQAALPPAGPGAAAGTDRAAVARGASLSAIGNCRGCHTAPGGGAPFAGGRALASPFGTIYSTNITPDPDTGIGRWSFEAFHRAMREGVRDDGAHLYPAFPYERFTHVTEEDNRALYAYLMAQPPVRYRPPAHALAFPFNVRAAIGAWKALYFRPGPRAAARAADAQLARGEYLVEGLGHCGSCHSPRNFAYAERRDRAYQGGEVEGWHGYAIDASNAAPVPWDAEALVAYLREGFHPLHGVSRGTMGLVTEELRHAPLEDVKAMAAYVASLMGPASPERRQRAAALLRDPLAARPGAARDEGAAIYETACLGCHDGRRELPFGGLPLALSIGVHGESPRNLVNVILHGLPPAQGGETTTLMPGYAGAMSDAQVEALARWLRASFTDRPPWPDLPKAIREARAMTPSMLDFPPGGVGADPARVAATAAAR